MRRFISIPLSAMLLVALAAPAAAAGPSGRGGQHVPVGSYDFTITSDIGCAGFDVRVEDLSGKILEIYLGFDGRGNERGKTMYHVVTRYTRVGTDTSFVRAFHSIGHYSLGPDESLAVTSIGDTLLWGPEPAAFGLSDGIWLIEGGKLHLAYDPAGGIGRARLDRGSSFDVCAALG